MGRRRTEARKQKLSLGAGTRVEAPAVIADPVEALVVRARKLRQKGDQRRALLMLREACHLDEWRARTWTLLGAFLGELGQRGEAVTALHRARWLRARAGEKARAAVTARLAARFIEAA